MHAQSLSRVQLFVTPWTVATRLLCPWSFPSRNPGVGFAVSSSRGSSQPKDRTYVSCIGRRILYHWTSWEARDVRIEICIICCGNNDKTGSPFSWGDLAKVWGESWHFHWVWKDSAKNYFSFLIVSLIKPIFQKTFVNLICLIHLTLNNCYVPYTGLGPRDITRRQAGHPITRNNNESVYSLW